MCGCLLFRESAVEPFRRDGQDSPDYNILILYYILFEDCYDYFFRIQTEFKTHSPIVTATANTTSSESSHRHSTLH